MIMSPRRAGSTTSGGGRSRPTTTRSYSGVNATSACSTVRESPAVHMKREPTWYERRSRASAVEAARSMMIGASISSDSGMTTPP
jgi:hypothetical protein